MDLAEIRQRIDATDRQIVELYEQRMDLCREVAQYKIENGKKVFDHAREMEKLAMVRSLAHGDFNEKGVQELFEQLMSMSRKMQYQILTEHGSMGKLPFIEIEDLDREHSRVVFQGAEGSYSEIAMRTFFGKKVSAFHVDTFRDAMSAIDDGSADYAVLPIENSTAGIVNEIFDLLVEFENYIIGEQIIPIEHCLMGVPGSDIRDIRTVLSHPQSLMQSADFLSARGWNQMSMKNNAFAAQKVAQDGDRTQAAIASELAAETYGLKILERGVNSSDTNSTRFIIVTNQKVFCRGAQKISICFELPHRSGSLYHMLSHFIYNDLNLCKIESRPMPDQDWEYRFFVDIEGSLSDGAVKNALRGLRDEAKHMRILGTY
ncbi:MAG: prephenate dehydratase [Lachnospiraceae bacterium]|jgi:chorismate mutase/prephenate dehydratase|nr:prephenate dehydratase [Lachnospiraceae bacterium]